MTHDGRAGRAASLEHVEKTGRKAGLDGELSEPDGGKGRELRRLEQHGIAGYQRRRHLHRRIDQRKVPRDDRTDNPIGLVHDHARRVGCRGRQHAFDLVGLLTVIPDDLGGTNHVARHRLRDEAGGRPGFQPGKLLHVPDNEVGEPDQDGGAIPRIAPGPSALAQRRHGGARRPVHRLLACRLDRRDDAKIGRTADLDFRAVSIGYTPAVDEVRRIGANLVWIEAERHGARRVQTPVSRKPDWKGSLGSRKKLKVPVT